ncbi:MAG: hypothetical protein LBS43_01475 [Prevotellaceae bacterium]|jgi:hypothetical protein|nr:hypothetical protein [Prevotellaceae bacterium]
MGMSHIPRSDSKFFLWSKSAYPYATSQSNITRWKLPSDAVTPELEAAYNDWITKYPVAINVETRTAASITAKSEARHVFEPDFRKYLKAYVMYNPNVNDEDRRNLQLAIPDTTQTTVGPPTDAPTLEIDFSKRQKHSVIVKNLDGKRSKPANAHGYEVWQKIGGERPLIDDEFKYAGFSTKSPFQIQYPLANVGAIVWYRGRWVNSKNEPGPWSEIVYAIIG